MSLNLAHGKFHIFGMEKIPFVVTITLLVLSLSVEVPGNAGKGIKFVLISFLVNGIPSN